MEVKLRALKSIQRQIETVNGQENPYDSRDFVMATESQNALLVNQTEGVADLAICLQAKLLEEFGERHYPSDFRLEDFPSLSVLVEELSHFNYFVEKTRLNQQIRPLDLEIQSEVDKFSFALSCLQGSGQEFQDEIFELLFDQIRLGDWVDEQERARYHDAHQIARSFCRAVLNESSCFDDQRSLFQAFFSLTPQEKRRWKSVAL
ncbi:MAG: hypothetical protein EA369_04710 [Bradymonadales bacterium]|nr:MAG: hypothetical protein EA369_04710 [Bradymonadales bacterium]